MKKRIKLFLVVFLLSISTLATLVNVPSADAVSGACFFNTTAGAVTGTTGCGESGLGAYGTNDVFHFSSGRSTSGAGQAIPTSRVGANNKNDFINMIKNQWTGSTQNKVGAHFIVQKMLKGNDRSWPSNADLDTWVEGMQQSNVTLSSRYDSSVGDTSWYDDDKHNIFFANHDNVGRDVIEIKQNGNLLAQIERPCGNLVALNYSTLQGPPKWSITPTSGVSNAHPRPGDTVTYTSNAQNGGPNATDKTVTMTMQRSVNSGGWSNQGSWNKGSGWGNGGWFGAKTKDWVPGQGDDGKTVCQRTVVDPRAWNNNGSLASAQDCATAWQKWQVSATTTESHTGVSVGSTIAWTHKLTHNDDNTTAVVTPTLTYSGSDTRTTTPAAIAKNWASSSTKTYTNTYTIKSTDAGKSLCQGISANPSQRLSWNASPSGTVSSTKKCVDIPYDYELVPSITTNPATPSEVDTPLSIIPSVNNTGPTQSAPTQWEVHRLVYDPGADPSLTGNNSTSDACGYFSATSRASCDVVSGANGSGTGKVFPTGVSSPNAGSLSQKVPALDPGSKVCYVLSVKPWKNRPGVSGGTDWKHSTMVCVIVAKKPKLHIEGGDLKTRGAVKTSVSNVGGKTFGSWVEYGVFSTGANDTVASGGGLKDGNTNNLPSAWSQLTFANTPTLGGFSLGTYSSAHDYFMAQQQTGAAGSSLTLSGTGTKILGSTSNVTINASTIPVGGTFVVKTTGTVTIAGDITYDTTGSVSTLGKIPQVVIVANDIKIKDNVSRIDAWLLADGNINTCSNGPTGSLTANDCATKLEINGPVSANSINVRRTAGATKDNPESAAEIFQLTPTTYLWAFDFTNQADRVKTTYVTEEPPRF